MIVVGVDPGKASGIAVLEWDGESDVPQVLYSLEADPESFADEIYTAHKQMNQYETL